MTDWNVGTNTDRDAKPGRVYVLEPDKNGIQQTVCVARDEETAEDIAHLHNSAEKVVDALLDGIPDYTVEPFGNDLFIAKAKGIQGMPGKSHGEALINLRQAMQEAEKPKPPKSDGACVAFVEVTPGLWQPRHAPHEPGAEVFSIHTPSHSDRALVRVCLRCGVVYVEEPRNVG